MNYDVAVIGSGAAGMMAAIRAATKGHRVALFEKLPVVGAKLKATGGGRCNLTNTLEKSTFMHAFGKNGKFMRDVLEQFDSDALIHFFDSLGVKTHAPDGFRVFPLTHQSQSVVDALKARLQSLNVITMLESEVTSIIAKDGKVSGIVCNEKVINAAHVILATGGLGYPTLGAHGDGYKMANKLGHQISTLFPAMTPLQCKEEWVKQCTADTIAKVQIKVALKKYAKFNFCGDLIFTKNGIRGPVVLDCSRELTPLISEYKELPIVLNMIKGMNEHQIYERIKQHIAKHPTSTSLDVMQLFLPESVSKALLDQGNIAYETIYKNISGVEKDALIKLLAKTPLTLIGEVGFEKAMITRGGISLKEVNPKTMQSKLLKGLYFCGEILDIDGPCGGYNLQWSFSSGYVAGSLQP